MKYNLFLGAGGVRCLAQIGALKAIDDANLDINKVVGLSGGSIIGYMYSTGLTPHDIEAFVLNTDFNSMARGSLEILKDAFQAWRIPPLFDATPFIDTVLAYTGIPYNYKYKFIVPVSNFVKRTYVAHSITEETSYEVIERILRASVSIKGLFTPVYIDGDACYDGAIMLGNCPIDLLQDSENCRSIALNASHPPHEYKVETGLLRSLMETLELTQYKLWQEQLDDVKNEIAVNLEVSTIATDFKITKTQKLAFIDKGEEQMKRVLDSLI